ncbi:hypothetical protein QE152_g20002 [Popillia japonica]|uniref:Uncharacterized protein n=1 Tax=Popillia japonica TaxID=7064 RepID=A0AAW1KM35_POPJA
MKSDTKNSVNIEKSDVENEEDDDVIIVNSEAPSNKLLSEPPPLVKISTEKSNLRPYLKVRSVSQLLAVSSECITIPDEPQGSLKSDVPVEEKDPLKFSPVISEQSSFSTESKHSDDDIILGEPLDEATIKEKNMLTERKIDQLATEHMKLKILDVPEYDLKRILSVHVLISTNFRENLPDSRLKLLGSHTGGTDLDLSEHSVEENQIQSIDSNLETDFDNSNNVIPAEINPVTENVILTSNEVVAEESGKCEEALSDENQCEEGDLQENLDINDDANKNEVDDGSIMTGDTNAAEENLVGVLNEITNSNNCDTNAVLPPEITESTYETESSTSARNEIAREAGSEDENAE